jgi:hypothetical protein
VTIGAVTTIAYLTTYMKTCLYFLNCLRFLQTSVLKTSTIFFFKYCLLAIRLEDRSVYNLICCLVVVSWKGDHPAMLPQSCRSEVQRPQNYAVTLNFVKMGAVGAILCLGT